MIPIKDAMKSILFNMAGVIISHSVCQQASIGFPVIAPYVYEYITGSHENEIELLLKKDLIPLDASTSLLHNLLNGLDSCESDADIEALLEGNQSSEAYWQLIKQLNSETFKNMMLTVTPSNFAEEQAYKWLLEYISQEESEEFPGDSRCGSLLQFWTGWSAVPFGGLLKRLKVTFLADDEKHSLPTICACTAILRLPTVQSSKSKFFEAMDIACKYGKCGFPNPEIFPLRQDFFEHSNSAFE